MAKNNKDLFAEEVDKSLGDFFEDEAKSADPLENPKSGDPKESPFTDLNAIVLSIEWEITDQIMTGLIAEINKLKEIYRNDKILYSFLKLQGSVGKYISSKKVTALPDSIKLLHSIYGGLEKVAQSPEMSYAEKKRMLSAEVNKFKALKEQIILANKGVSERMDIKPGEETRPVTPTEEIKPRSLETSEIPEKTVAREDREVPSKIPAQKLAAEDTDNKKDWGWRKGREEASVVCRRSL